MMTAQDNATLIRSRYDAFNHRDFDKGLAMVADGVKWLNIPFEKTFTSRAGYREYLENWTTGIPDCKVEIVNLIAGAEWLAAECIVRGTHTGNLVGPLGAIPATQKKLELKFCEVFRVKDGLILEGHVYFDTASMMRQLGIVPPTQSANQPVPAHQ